jgi:hypothetical protein
VRAALRRLPGRHDHADRIGSVQGNSTSGAAGQELPLVEVTLVGDLARVKAGGAGS